VSDITNTHLEAAILDQKVAGVFPRQRYAFVAVTADDGYRLGVAVANENGYSPIDGKRFDNWDDAKRWAISLNEHIGLSRDEAASIIISTMRGPA
jgi:hypothetical protein